MKTNLVTALTAIALMGLVFVGTAYAEDTTTTPKTHEEHHTDTNAPAPKDTKTMVDQSNMMGKMDMAQMHSMMGECMKTHKDGKMCDKNTMNKCEENMGKDECQKMMMHTKAQSKTKKK